jgi:hypothetical protein
MLLRRRVPYRGCSGMVYFGFVSDLAHPLGIKRNPSINSGTIIPFSILPFGIPAYFAPTNMFFSGVLKRRFF